MALRRSLCPNHCRCWSACMPTSLSPCRANHRLSGTEPKASHDSAERCFNARHGPRDQACIFLHQKLCALQSRTPQIGRVEGKGLVPGVA